GHPFHHHSPSAVSLCPFFHVFPSAGSPPPPAPFPPCLQPHICAPGHACLRSHPYRVHLAPPQAPGLYAAEHRGIPHPPLRSFSHPPPPPPTPPCSPDRKSTRLNSSHT